MSSPAHFDALPYGQRLQAVLLGQCPPEIINLGIFFRSDGSLVKQAGFVPMSGEQLQQLARLLQTQPIVTLLNLMGNGIAEKMQELVACIKFQTRLKILDLSCTCLRC